MVACMMATTLEAFPEKARTSTQILGAPRVQSGPGSWRRSLGWLQCLRPQRCSKPLRRSPGQSCTGFKSIAPPRRGALMKMHLHIPRTLTAALALAILALSVSCLYPGPWHEGRGWRGPGHYHRR